MIYPNFKLILVKLFECGRCRAKFSQYTRIVSQQPNFGSTKRRQYYYKQAAKYLTTAPPKKKSCRRVEEPESVIEDDSSAAAENEGTRYRLYALDLRLSCPIPDDQGHKFGLRSLLFLLFLFPQKVA